MLKRGFQGCSDCKKDSIKWKKKEYRRKACFNNNRDICGDSCDEEENEEKKVRVTKEAKRLNLKL